MNYKLFNKKGFTLAEMVVTMSIISILFVSMGSVITKLIKDQTSTKSFVKLQQESYSHVNVLEKILKSAQNVLKIPYLKTEKYLYDTLIIKNESFTDAPFALVKPVKKSLDAKEGSNLKLDEKYADEKFIEEDYYMWVSSMYFWSDVVVYGKYVVYTDPLNQKVKIMDTSIKKTDLTPYAEELVFDDDYEFLMPTGITKTSDPKIFYVSDRNSHTIWQVTIEENTNIVTRELTATRELVLWSPNIYGTRDCKTEDEDCEISLLNQPNGLVVKDDFLYIADSGNHRIIRFDIENEELEELIYNDDHESWISKIIYDAQGLSLHDPYNEFYLNTPVDIAIKDTDLYFTDSFNHRIIKVDMSETEKADWTISIFWGTGIKGFSWDYGDADLARISYPTGLYVSSIDLFFADSWNNAIRKIKLWDNTKIYPHVGNTNTISINERLYKTLSKNEHNNLQKDTSIKLISRQRPNNSNTELNNVLNFDNWTTKAQKQLIDYKDSFLNYPTGLFVDISTNDVFIVDSFNNSIKVAKSSMSTKTYEPFFNVILSNLEQNKLKGKLFPIVRDFDFGNYNLDTHVLTGENDFISPFPLKHMYFDIHGQSNKMIKCNIATNNLSEEELSSNNFKFSINLRNEVK